MEINIENYENFLRGCISDGIAKDKLGCLDCETELNIITRLREAEKDAARYRWLCEQAWFQVESEWQLSLGETETEDEFIAGANEKIDQAMKEKCDE